MQRAQRTAHTHPRTHSTQHTAKRKAHSGPACTCSPHAHEDARTGEGQGPGRAKTKVLVLVLDGGKIVNINIDRNAARSHSAVIRLDDGPSIF
jgi:hypothetical protein